MDDHFKYNIYGCLEKYIPIHPDEAWKQPLQPKPVLIVGYSQAAEAYIERVLTHKQWGYDILGILDDHLHTNESSEGHFSSWLIESLEEYLSKNIAESIIITLKLKEYDRLEEIVHVCEKSGVSHRVCFRL